MDTTTRFTDERKKSLRTIIGLAAIFLFSLIATGLIVYNFASCPDEPPIITPCHEHHIVTETNYHSNNEITTTPHNTFTAARTANLDEVVSSEEIKTTALTPIQATGRTSTTTIQAPSATTTDSNQILEYINKTPKPTTGDHNLRLPRSISPVSYNIKLIPFFEERNFTFEGYSRIVVNCIESTNNITLHAITLTIIESDVAFYQLIDIEDEDNEMPIPIHNITFIEKKQFLIIHFEENLSQNSTYVIYINYTGLLNDDLKGFYRSSYQHGNETR